MEIMPKADVRQWIAGVLGGPADADFRVEALLTEVLDQSELEGVTPLLRHHLEQAGQLEFLPLGLQMGFQQIDRKHLAADMATQNELLSLLKIFQSHNIDFIMLKGEALSHSGEARVFTLQNFLRFLCVCARNAANRDSHGAWVKDVGAGNDRQ